MMGKFSGKILIYLSALFSGILGLTAFCLFFDPKILDPTNINWLLEGDRAQHFFGYLFFIFNQSWELPMGTVKSLIYPIGTNLVFTDSLPWVGIIVKPFENLLPFPFQYSGIWLAVCYFLQGYFAYLILVQLRLRGALLRFIGVLFFVVSPVLLFRNFHLSLCAHWLILWALSLSLSVKHRVYKWLSLIIISLGVHPYLAAMVAFLAIFDVLKRGVQKKLTTVRAVTFLIVYSLGIFVTISLLGYWEFSHANFSGFGYWSADLLTFLNPQNKSLFLSSNNLSQGQGQYEGFAYFGLGVLVLALVGLMALLKSRKFVFPALFWACFALFIYSLSSKISINGKLIYDLSWLYSLSPLNHISEHFRSSGRFVWPLYYFLLACIIVGASKIVKNKKSTLTFIILAFCLQIYDLKDFYLDKYRVVDHYIKDFQMSGELAELKGKYKHLYLNPPHIPYYSHSANWNDKYYGLALYAAENKMTMNSGSATRYDRDGLNEYYLQLHSCRLDTLYVFQTNPNESYKH
jgi:hypothetical protein